MNSTYLLKRGDDETGPYTLEQLRQMEKSGQLLLTDFLRAEGSDTWKPANHVPGLLGRSMPLSTNAKVLVGAGAGCGMLLVGVLMVVALVSQFSGSKKSSTIPTQSPQEIIEEFTLAKLNEKKQRIFDALYPTGTAKEVRVHAVTIDAWKAGSSSLHVNDVQQFTVRFTLYWQSPLIADGYTKISQVQDMESGRTARTEILMSNANITNRDVGEALLFLGGELLFGD